MILYINNEHCSSVEQLKGYFTENLTYNSDIYADLLDYGKNGDIAVWLREMGEIELANDVESIPDDLSNSFFYAQLKVAVTGRETKEIDSLRPPFEKCFKFENMTFDTNEIGVKVSVQFKIVKRFNEVYTLLVCSNQGTSSKTINSNEYSEGEHVCFDFLFQECLLSPNENITLRVDGKDIATLNVNKEKILSLPSNNVSIGSIISEVQSSSLSNNISSVDVDATISEVQTAVKTAVDKIATMLQSFYTQKESLLADQESLSDKTPETSDVSSRSNSSFDFEAYRRKSEEMKIEYARQKEKERKVLDLERRKEWEIQKTKEAIERFRRKHGVLS